MANITVPKKYKLSGGPIIDVEVSNAANPFQVGSVMSFSTGKAIPAAEDAVDVGLVVSHYEKDGDTWVRLDIGGAIALDCVYTSAVAFGPIKWADNQTVATRDVISKHGGRVVRVVSTNVADVALRPFAGSNAPNA